MKKFIVPLLLVSAFFIIFEQSKAQPNLYLTIIAIVVFMFAMMQLSALIPSKNQDNSDDNVQ